MSGAFVIMVTYALANVVGLLKTRLIISQFFLQASSLDVYYASLTIPDTLFQLLVIGALSAAFIPIFTRNLHHDEKTAWKMTSSTMNLVSLSLMGICILVAVFATPISRLLAPGYTPAQIDLMSNLIRIMLTAQVFFSISGFLTAIIQSHQRFLVPALAPVAYNLGIILGILLFGKTLGIYAPATGMVIGALLHMFIQIPVAYKLGFRYQLLLGLDLPGVKEVLRLMPARVITLGVDQIEQFVAVLLTSFLAAGSLTLLNVARLLFNIPSLLFGSTIGQAALPSLSHISAKNERSEFAQTLISSLFQVIFMAVPVSVLFIVLRIPIVRLAFGSKTFPWEATLLTGGTLAILAVSSVFYAAMQLLVRAFYALSDTRTPLWVGLMAALFDSGLAIILSQWGGMGILGIAVAISATAVIESLVLLVLIVEKMDNLINLRFFSIRLFQLGFLGILTGFCLWVPMRLLDKFIFDTTRTLPLLGLTIITSVIGFGVYILFSYLLKIPELELITRVVKKMANWRRMFAANPPDEAMIVPAPDQN